MRDLTSLVELGLDGNYISDYDLRTLADLSSLRVLELDQNLISDVSSLPSLTRLERLDLGANRVSGTSLRY